MQPKKEETSVEVNMKEWILRYAEQQDEEEKGEGSKGLEEEEKFDPGSLLPDLRHHGSHARSREGPVPVGAALPP